MQLPKPDVLFIPSCFTQGSCFTYGIFCPLLTELLIVALPCTAFIVLLIEICPMKLCPCVPEQLTSAEKPICPIPGPFMAMLMLMVLLPTPAVIPGCGIRVGEVKCACDVGGMPYCVDGCQCWYDDGGVDC